MTSNTQNKSTKSILVGALISLPLLTLMYFGFNSLIASKDNDNTESERIADLEEKYSAIEQSKTVIFEGLEDKTMTVLENGENTEIEINDDVTFYIGTDFKEGTLSDVVPGTFLNLYYNDKELNTIRSEFTAELE